MSAEEGGGGGGGFIPKENLVAVLVAMGVSRNAALKGLYHTGNNNADLAAAWIFENQDKDLDSPFLAEEESSSEDEVLEAGLEDFLDEGAFNKMVFVVNTSLNMGVGKMAAQVAHAALGLYRHVVEEQQRYGEMLLQWEQFGETKIVLKGKDASELAMLSTQASAMGLPFYVVQDAGKTQIPSGSVTVLAMMGKTGVVNEVTGSLSLL